MKRHILFLCLASFGAMALGYLTMGATSSTASAASLAEELVPLQNPVQGTVNRKPMRPTSVGFEQNTLGVAVDATRTTVANRLQTEFRLRNIPALPGQRYEPQVLSRAVFTLNGLPVELNPQNNWLVAFPADLIQRDNEIALDIYGANGGLVSSLSNRIGL